MRVVLLIFMLAAVSVSGVSQDLNYGEGFERGELDDPYLEPRRWLIGTRPLTAGFFALSVGEIGGFNIQVQRLLEESRSVSLELAYFTDRIVTSENHIRASLTADYRVFIRATQQDYYGSGFFFGPYLKTVVRQNIRYWLDQRDKDGNGFRRLKLAPGIQVGYQAIAGKIAICPSFGLGFGYGHEFYYRFDSNQDVRRSQESLPQFDVRMRLAFSLVK